MASYVGNGGELNEEGYWRLLDDLFSPGSAIRTFDAWRVEQAGAGALSVAIKAGAGLIEYGSTYGYPAWIDADTSASIDTPDATNPRIDRVVAYIDLDMIDANPLDGSEVNNPGALKFRAVPGTPASSPTAPSDGDVQTEIGAANPFRELALVNVAANETAILTSMITSKRLAVALRAPIQRQIQTASADTVMTHAYDALHISASGGNRDVTLPDATLQTGREVSVRKTDSAANYVRVKTQGSQTINTPGNVSQNYEFLFLKNEEVFFISDGTNWMLSRETVADVLAKTEDGGSYSGVNPEATGLRTTFVAPGNGKIEFSCFISQAGNGASNGASTDVRFRLAPGGTTFDAARVGGNGVNAVALGPVHITKQVTGLTPGTSYTFAVDAQSSVGNAQLSGAAGPMVMTIKRSR